MSHNNCPQGSEPFSFEYQQKTKHGIFMHTLLIEGFACMKEDKPEADIDRVYLNNEDVKPLLEVNGGMTLIDIEATKYVTELLEQKQAA